MPLPTIDPQTVLRSARALDRYGPDFTLRPLPRRQATAGAAGLAGGAAGLVALAQMPPTRECSSSSRAPGEGPSAEQRAKAWFRVRFRREPAIADRRPRCRGGDPGYGETSKMLAESALCLALDELPERAGQLTPAVAMGRRSSTGWTGRHRRSRSEELMAGVDGRRHPGSGRGGRRRHRGQQRPGPRHRPGAGAGRRVRRPGLSQPGQGPRGAGAGRRRRCRSRTSTWSCSTSLTWARCGTSPSASGHSHERLDLLVNNAGIMGRPAPGDRRRASRASSAPTTWATSR